MSSNEFWKVMDKNFAQIVQLCNTAVEQSGCTTEFFQKLLDKDFDVNYKIPDNYTFEKDRLVGCTIFQLLPLTPDICQNLIDRGADYFTKDKSGSTVLLREASLSYEKYLDSLELGDAQEHNQKLCANVILSAQINSQNPKNPKDKNGLSHFHVACMYNHTDAAKFFLENGVSVNESVNEDSTFYPGYSALHFAVRSCAFETVELLTTLGADVFAKDSMSMNPLHVLLFERREIDVKMKSLPRKAFADKEKPAYRNLFNNHSKNEQMIYLLLHKLKEQGCYLDNDAGLTYFHVFCFMGNTSTVKQFLDNTKEYLAQSVSPDSPIWPGYTPLHFAAHSNVKTVELLVKYGADLSAKNADGVTPFDTCLREFPIADVYRILLLQPEYSIIVFSDGKTEICEFIHAMQKTETFGSFLKENLKDPNMFVPFDSPICAGYTPLHLAVISIEQPISWSSKNYNYDVLLEHEKSQANLSRIDLCLHHNPDVTTRDAKNFSPLHWAFRLRQSQVVDILLERHKSNSNPVDEHGLSHLHIACAAGNVAVVQKLLSQGANVNEVATSSHIWIAIQKVNSTIFSSFNMQHFINKGSTPLHFAANTLTGKKSFNTVEILIANGADIFAKDSGDLNPLERLLETPIFQDSVCHKPPRRFIDVIKETIKLLLKKIGDKLVDTKPKQMLYCYSLLEDELLREILCQGDESVMKILASVGITALHVACFNLQLKRMNKLLDEIDVNARVDLESPLWPGCTALHLFTSYTSDNLMRIDNDPQSAAIVQKFLRNGADVAAANAEGETPIHRMLAFTQYSKRFITLLEHLKDFSVNPTSGKGYTHLHVASACGAVSAVKKLLEHGAAIDQPTHYFVESMRDRDYAGCTALHFAVTRLQKDVVDVLLKHGADVNRRNAYGENSLHAASRSYREQWRFNLLQTLIKAGADIHARDMWGRTPLEVLIFWKKATMKEVELFLAHYSRVNTFNPMSGNGLLAIALKQNQKLTIFDMLVKDPGVKEINDNGRNAIHNVVAFERPNWIFLEDGEGIDRQYAPCDVYINGIATLLKLGLDIEHQDCKGSTPLHLAAQMQNLTGIVGLLENGADINIVDANGKTAFDYSLQLAKLHEEPKELDVHILGIILMHMYKLNLAGIGISRLNREMFAKINEIIPLDLSKVQKCKKEVETMKSKEIVSSSVTFYEFLSDTGAVSAFPYMLPCVQTAITSYFQNETKSLRKQFPQLTGMLLLQYRKALARGDIINPALASLDILVGFDMPVLCSRVIFRFLSNDELNNLISSTNNE